ncbi:MTH938/NDUFAF3 family protein [Myceligenerans xiligouense]|uniref:MTH938/NDUFAF3 family protein n=1 Tax=Myceligenerans xiligouense TaxID=253184 RepID=UPI001B8855CA|nr:MTH938/NDUFAF3 family protein [Myceligenerans xiligouense]
MTRLAWGVVDVEGVGRFKDVILCPGGATAWDWGVTGTRHSPGIQPSDVDQAVAATRTETTAAGIEVIVLSRGMESRLGVHEDTVRYAESLGMEVHVAPTEDAVALYNEVAATRAVAALIHSTC